jgi:hypothetical protein
MMELVGLTFLVLLTTANDVSYASQAPSQTAGKERFEVSGFKAVRPTLVNTIAALKKGEV